MIIYIAADHRGFSLKENIKEILPTIAAGCEVIDMGATAHDANDDYPDFARSLAEKISARAAAAPADDTPRGIIICGSGFGVDIVANKYKGVRSALAMSAEHIRVGRHDDDVNVLALAADFITPDDARAIVRAFLETPFEKEEARYSRRLAKISQIEQGR